MARFEALTKCWNEKPRKMATIVQLFLCHFKLSVVSASRVNRKSLYDGI